MSDAAAAPGSFELTVNGRAERLGAGCSVEDLLRARGLAPEQVAVELNRELVPRAARATTELRAGDRVELVTLVGGG